MAAGWPGDTQAAHGGVGLGPAVGARHRVTVGAGSLPSMITPSADVLRIDVLTLCKAKRKEGAILAKGE
ncbi:hypothetical protein GCM10010429_36550 [Micromonospora olivasterospora]